MTSEVGPRPLWVLAHTAVENGYDITIQPRGSSLALIARRGRTEAVARWRRGDRHYQGDGEGRWMPDGRASFTDGGVHAWIALDELRDRFARPAEGQDDTGREYGCTCGLTGPESMPRIAEIDSRCPLHGWPLFASSGPTGTPDWLEALGDVPIRFWVCPIREHRNRNDGAGWPVVTVEWRGDIAHCTAPGCDQTSKPAAPTEGADHAR